MNDTLSEFPRLVYVHIHIPKCGGTTLRSILRRNFGEGFHHDSGLLTDYQYNKEQVLKIIRTHPWLRCYSTHRVSLDLPFESTEHVIRAITFIRDPIDRFISHYFFHRNDARMLVPEAKELGLEEYVEYALRSSNQPMYIDGQTRFLTGSPNQNGIGIIESHLAKRNLLMFPLSRFDEACVLLETLYPQDFRDCRYAVRNVTAKDQTVSPTLRREIASYSPVDQELLEISERFLSEAIHSLMDEDEFQTALDEFNSRGSS